MATSRGEALRLYRRILTLHKKKLAPHMRILGDQYVRCVPYSLCVFAASDGYELT